MAFCSWITSGRRVSQAATPPGPVTKPPKPTTSRGRRRRMTPQRLPDASAASLNGAASKVSDALAAQPAHRRATRSAMFSAGTTRASRPRRVPSHTTSCDAARSSARQRQRRKHVTAGAAGHDEDRARALRSCALPRARRVVLGRDARWPCRACSAWPRDTRAAASRPRPA